MESETEQVERVSLAPEGDNLLPPILNSGDTLTVRRTSTLWYVFGGIVLAVILSIGISTFAFPEFGKWVVEKSFSFLSEDEQESEGIATWSDEERVALLHEVQSMMEEHFSEVGDLGLGLLKFAKIYSVFLDNGEEEKADVFAREFYYAGSMNRTASYHIGIRLKDSRRGELADDSDFNSDISREWFNSGKNYLGVDAREPSGFDGADPIYDVVVIRTSEDATKTRDSKLEKIDKIIEESSTTQPKQVSYFFQSDYDRMAYARLMTIPLTQYYQEFGQFPERIEKTLLYPKSVKPGDISALYYSVAPNLKGFHLGIVLEDPSQKYLESDTDFSSEAAGWKDGFDGKDPIFDLRELYPE